MKKILFIVTALKRSGPINQLYQLVSNMDQGQYKVNIITLSPEGDNSIKPHFDEIVSDIECLNFSRYESAKTVIKSLKSRVDAIAPDLIHTQDLRSDFYTLFLKKYPCISTMHNYPYGDYPFSFGKKGTLMAFMHLRIFARKDKCITVSKSILDQLGYLSNPRFTYIRNGVDDTFFLPATQEEKYRLREELGLPADAVIYVTSAYLNERKDPRTLVKALSRSGSNNYFVCLGDGPLLEELTREFGSERIIFKGYQSDVVKWYHAADAYISASHMEGLPMGVIEAMACGLPAVLSDIPSHRELYDINEQAVALFETGNADSLQNVLDNELTMDKAEVERRSQAALSIVRDHLSARVMAKHYQDVYAETLSQGERT
ncbi:glycosyltransferase family 4 protein [Larsenimonas suaedae]|uniref:Glycosyltransferase family 4 protein n=1 Tax=Larsenimonas suaedae TaxID=1851019 RepID=A0ABU1GZ21_9GAMM|nr:glycosyltransferase family 4 protein [Larsenimonas suaedae]MCM2971555.1 glycosyltransferase family 4 protein [Larsenimonas suaedae]MDR5896811.1 glycosyltransferase family 4 protein [Larsenimonas suaedae]